MHELRQARLSDVTHLRGDDGLTAAWSRKGWAVTAEAIAAHPAWTLTRASRPVAVAGLVWDAELKAFECWFAASSFSQPVDGPTIVRAVRALVPRLQRCAGAPLVAYVRADLERAQRLVRLFGFRPWFAMTEWILWVHDGEAA